MITTPPGAERAFGLRFLQDAANHPLGAAGLGELARLHGDATFGARNVDPHRWDAALERLRAVFAESDPVRASTLLNAELASTPATTELTLLDDGRWALRPAIAPRARADEALLAIGAFALATWLAERGRCAWGVCAADDCERVFIDEGRRHPQRFCSTACATRTRVAAHRRRNAGTDVEPS
ncbi:CGNR zinc finger domain-containing protein [Streptomyces sp. AC495_CC817]|uniref:CGNR zinc finger domain-containing protein n=1 Tax=Streptomyces sp. AC495_CC817 TaxID=2823900 RepID=UPI001C274988|nr:CGNR zinc finger domain-containing protein [Streptomyces sp. AC495_CC817]